MSDTAIAPKIIKKFLYVNRKAPYGTIYALEALEAVLIGAAFDQDVSLAFLDDGVFQLTKGQNARAIGMKTVSPAFGALGDFGVTRLYVEAESLAERGLTRDDLMIITHDFENGTTGEVPSIIVVDRARMSNVMAEHDIVLTF